MSDTARREAAEGVREAAFRILRRVEEDDAWASVLLEGEESRQADRRDAALLHEIVLGVLRHRTLLDEVVGRVASREPSRIDPPVRIALRIGAYGLLLMDRVPDYAAVDTSVRLVRRHGPPAAVGFANAVLRRLAEGGRGLLPPAPAAGDTSALAIRHSHPRWWVERVVGRLGWEGAARLLAANNLPAPTVVRPNLRRTTPRDLALRLEAEGVRTEPGTRMPEALRVRSGVVQRTRTFREGYAWVQDEAAQLVGRLFGRVLRPRVLDLCAAPGAKTLQLAESLPLGGLLVATDRHARRLARVAASLRRTGVQGIHLVAADMAAARPAVRGPFDHVLVDAPCSGTGTLRRRPEIRWRLRPEDLDELAARQARLLAAAAALLVPGGDLVYAVCSLEPEEGEAVVARFLEARPDFRRADPRGALPDPARELVGPDAALRTSPAIDGLDGFYAVRLERAVAS